MSFTTEYQPPPPKKKKKQVNFSIIDYYIYINIKMWKRYTIFFSHSFHYILDILYIPMLSKSIRYKLE